LWPIEGPASVVEYYGQGLEFSERRAIREFALAMSSARLEQLVDVGQWDMVPDEAAALAAQAESTGDVANALQARWAHVRVLVARGRAEEARPLADWLVEAARASGGAEDIVAGFAVAAETYLTLGDADPAIG